MATKEDPPLPQPPFFTIPNINNLRDAALINNGLKLSTGTGKIRPGVLFRSADVSQLDVSGWLSVKEIGVGHVFDLRSKTEVEKGLKGITCEEEDGKQKDVRPGWIADMESAGVKRTWVPVFEESDYSPERLAERYLKYMDRSTEGFVQAYEDISRHAGPAYRVILQYLANLPVPEPPKEDTLTGGFLSNDPKAPIPNVQQSIGALVHCTAGKDRTGMFFGILFSFLGVSREDIADEYNLTELGLAHVREQVVSRLMQVPGFRQYMLGKMAGRESLRPELADILQRPDEGIQIPDDVLKEGREAALRMISARKEAMLGALDMVDREWGSAEGYLRSVVGLTDEELENLRKVLVVDV